MMPKNHSTSSRTTGQQQGSRLSRFDGKRIAVVIERDESRFVYRGTANYVCDDQLGNALRIAFEGQDAGNPVLYVSEDDWDGRIIPDLQYGCHFCLIPSPHFGNG